MVRRVVIGWSDGECVVASDEDVAADGMSASVWGSDTITDMPNDGSAPVTSGYFPPAGGYRVFAGSFPSGYGDSVGRPAGAPVSEIHERTGDPPGMHWTDTIDIAYIVDGEIVLVTDAGREILLRAGDWVVQNGTRHAWKNRSPKTCRMIVFMQGAAIQG